jgi:uncharacterized damage-inducible protein DinB
MKSLADRFRRWYEYERDCNAKSLAMLESVPVERRGAPEFQKAVDRMAHLVAGRQRWLSRLGPYSGAPTAFPQGKTLADLPGMVAQTEAAWVEYLSRLDDTELAREFEWVAMGRVPAPVLKRTLAIGIRQGGTRTVRLPTCPLKAGGMAPGVLHQ